MVPGVFVFSLQDEKHQRHNEERDRQRHKSTRANVFFLLLRVTSAEIGSPKEKRKPKHTATTAVTANAQKHLFPIA